MGKMINELKKLQGERSKKGSGVSPIRMCDEMVSNDTEGGQIKNIWLTWIAIVVVVIGIFIVLNYQGEKDAVPLSEIFPDKAFINQVEYEFVDETQPAVVAPKLQENIAAQPVKEIVEDVKPVVEAVVEKDFENIAFTIQVSSFKEKSQAEKALIEVQKVDSSAYLMSRDLGEKGIWYRIYVGKFDTKASAETVLLKVKERYKDSFIISPIKSN